ncbi:glycosyltransferase family 2 protein [Aestuariibaculum sp. YM273]|uniref:glycosyltransferase family 2 protein n=1 Tax=Aestuariibaculum sp. YM273 TaxID=3070659 RepID=UPI0027DCE1FA|nr:glycosyltransferase family 2 protein [Aestuariibaculum sp. YM273]WMI65824.1 glycosyltransferase family 2 protein [Aestuariibaculum sp. YM273]
MLAIVIPYYKITFFEETLQSLANQTDKRFKVYIGDDASADDPKHIIAKYGEALDLVYHRFETNLGGVSLVKHWDRCLELMKQEEWFMVLGDDDVLGAECVQQFYLNLKEVNAFSLSVIRFATVIINDESQVVSEVYKHPKLEKSTDFFYKRLTNKTRSSLSEYIFSKAVYDDIGFYHYNLGWFTDDRAWLEFSRFGNIYTINEACVQFRLGATNISRDTYLMNEKTTVRLMFFKYLLTECLQHFSIKQRRYLLLYYEQLVYKNDKLSFNFWWLVYFSFIKQLNFIQSIKFTRRVILQALK